MGEYEELDVADEREHCPGRLAEHRARDVVRLRHEAVVPCISAPARRSMRRKSSWCLSSSSVKRTSASRAVWSPSQWSRLHFAHLRADEALDQSKHVGVGAPLDLAHEARLGGAQELELVRLRKPVEERNFFAVSSVRLRITSRSMSKRTASRLRCSARSAVCQLLAAWTSSFRLAACFMVVASTP